MQGLHRGLVDEAKAQVGLGVHPHLRHDVARAGDQLELVDAVGGGVATGAGAAANAEAKKRTVRKPKAVKE